MAKQYNCIGMGGTFDHLHRGHREFIAFAAGLAEKVVIGVTDSAMTANKLFPQLIETHTERTESVKMLCTDREISAEVVSLHDVYGPTVTSLKIDALAVTEETVAGGAAINAERVKLGLQPLPVHVFPLVRDESGIPITSTRIRAGEIGREGQNYVNLFSNDLILTDTQREFFANPLGPLAASAPSVAPNLTYVVGDVCVNNFHKNSWQFHAGWFDGKTQRKQSESKIMANATFTVINPAGTLATDAILAILAVLNQHVESWSHCKLPQDQVYTFVIGEEDLCAVALALLAPLESLIYYGQPNKGMIELTVTEDVKNMIYTSLQTA